MARSVGPNDTTRHSFYYLFTRLFHSKSILVPSVRVALCMTLYKLYFMIVFLVKFRLLMHFLYTYLPFIRWINIIIITTVDRIITDAQLFQSSEEHTDKSSDLPLAIHRAHQSARSFSAMHPSINETRRLPVPPDGGLVAGQTGTVYHRRMVNLISKLLTNCWRAPRFHVPVGCGAIARD